MSQQPFVSFGLHSRPYLKFFRNMLPLSDRQNNLRKVRVGCWCCEHGYDSFTGICWKTVAENEWYFWCLNKNKPSYDRTWFHKVFFSTIGQYNIPLAKVELLDSQSIKAVNSYSNTNMEEIPTLFCEFHGTETAVQVKFLFYFVLIIWIIWYFEMYFCSSCQENHSELLLIYYCKSLKVWTSNR